MTNKKYCAELAGRCGRLDLLVYFRSILSNFIAIRPHMYVIRFISNLRSEICGIWWRLNGEIIERKSENWNISQRFMLYA